MQDGTGATKGASGASASSTQKQEPVFVRVEDAAPIDAASIPTGREIDDYVDRMASLTKGLHLAYPKMDYTMPQQLPRITRKPTATHYVEETLQTTITNNNQLDGILTAPKYNVAAEHDAKVPQAVRNNPDVVKTVVLNFSDVHGADIQNFVRVAWRYIKTYGRENVIVTSGGDGFTGSYLLNKYPEWGLSQLLHMGVDAWVMGNHEVDRARVFLSNLGYLKTMGLWRPGELVSMVGSGPNFLVGKLRILNGIIQEDTLPYVIKVTARGERVGIIGLGKPGYGNVEYKKGFVEEAQEDFRVSLARAVEGLKNHQLDHIIILQHESLNDSRADSRSAAIEQEIANLPPEMRNLVRVVYEGHSHHVNHRVSDVDKILHLQGKGNGGAMWGTVLYRVPGGETYVSNVLWDGKNSGELAEDERRSLPESMAYATDQLKSTIQEDLEAPILKLVGLRDHRTSGHSNFLDPAVANMVADAFYWYGKKLSREADNSQKLILTDNGAPISKDRIIGASSYLNTGKFDYDEYMTLAALTDHYPNPEPYAVRRITGQQLTDYIRENLVYWDESGEVVSSFAFSHNLRVIVSGIKTQKQANGKMKVTAENVRLYILTGPEGERKYMPIELDGTYYLGMPHHMMVGLYEASGFANAERYGDFTSIYKEERLSFSDVMEKFFREASVSRAHKLPENTTPRKWYRAQTLPIDVKPDAVPFREYYTVDAEGNRVILDEENLLWDTSRHPYTLVDVGGGRKMRMPVHSIPVFETHAGRILNADNALPFLPDNATLDALYAGEASWGDVFSTPADGGFVQQVSEDTSVLGKAGNFLKNNKTAQVVIGAVALGGAMALMDVLTPGTGVLAASILPFFGFHNADDLGPSEEEVALLEKENAAKTAYATQFNENLKERLANRAAGIEEAKEAPLSFDEVAPTPIPQLVLLQKKAHVFRAPIEKVGGVGAFVNWLTRLHPNRANKTVAVPTAARNTTSTVYINAPMQNLKDAPEILDMPNTKEALLATYAKNLPKGISPNVAKQTVILNFSDLHGLPATSVIQILEAHWDAFGRENVIVVSGGDIATGGYILNEHSELGAYILSHTDAALYGNHEFDMANDYVANLLTLKSFGLWSTNMAESKVGSGPAILGHKVRMFKGVIDTLPFTVKTTINKERVMVVGLPKAGYGNVFYTQPEQAHASVKETLDVAIAYAKQHPVDHIIIVAHEALNDRRADTRSKEIASALAAAPENIRKIVRVVYEGHSHKPQMWVSDTDNILHTQGSAKGEATNAIVGTVLYRVPGRATYVSTQLWNSTDGAMQAPVPGTAAHIYNTIEKQLENMHGGLDKPFALFTEPLVRFQEEPNKGSVENGYINYHDNSASNFMADAERNAIKQKIRISPMTGVAELMDHGLGSAPVAIDKYQVIGAASKDNSGKVPYKGAMTLRLLSEHFPNPEPTSLARTTGLGFIELVKNNISIIDGKIIPTFYFSHNVRIAYDVEIGTRQVKKIVKEKVNGKEVAVEKEVSETYPVVHDVHVYMLGYDDKYTPIDEEGIYYLAMPDHMRVGWYEGKDIPFFLDKNPVYIEGLDRMSTTMQKFMQSAPVQLAQKIRLHPPHWYENQLAPVRPMVSDVDNPMNLPVFAPRYGRMLDLRSLPFIPTKEQLDALYAGELEYGDVFGAEEGGFVRQLPEDTPVPEVDLSNPLTNN